MGDWHDTILNVNVFAFIGLLIWLMIKPVDQIEPEIDAQSESQEKID